MLKEVSVHHQGKMYTRQVEVESVEGKAGWFTVKGEGLDGEYLTYDALLKFFAFDSHEIDEREEFGDNLKLSLKEIR